jgi:hypothetical protein
LRAVARYAAAGFVLVACVTLALWPWLDGPARRGVAGAAMVALPLQVVLFALLVGKRDRVRTFFAIWAGGTLIRMGVIVAAVVVVVRTSTPPLPTLLALAGFLFGLLLLEPFFFRLRPSESIEGT